ncbi:SDR family oxidoreductase [Undibacterium sp. TS12]|uniref:NAD-dependent epimerase/dehydratase family protein n=1 Tax=Undibacterium sp. TS12 TaxID=2908202 RepID=UPI001F4C5BAC|nr:SDR family oxidoreductase [Undibacterium sp. TS12]MCH8618788.1 SDR family oxidoreductase [Undibacterium sp. TS12]
MSQHCHATLIGGKGFIGRHLHTYLQSAGWTSHVPEKDDVRLTTEHLGHVFYCAGLTADFRQRPYATVDAHVSLLAKILQHGQFDTLTYLSSTRVYAGASDTDEAAVLSVQAHAAGDLYNLSKLMGESLCLHGGRNTRVVRLSNVFGMDMPEQNFLSEVLSDAAKCGQVVFRSAPESQKDYVSIADVVRFLPLIATKGEIGIYNLARGSNTTHASLALQLEQMGVRCEFENGAPNLSFPPIRTNKLEAQFGPAEFELTNELQALFNHYKKHHEPD